MRACVALAMALFGYAMAAVTGVTIVTDEVVERVKGGGVGLF